ncbi:MAG: hypothetical protein AAF360_07370, partial [Pseudomonadota bacterium]
MIRMFGALCAVGAIATGALLSLSAEADAQYEPIANATVTLTNDIGSFKLTGALIEFTGAEYVLATTIGEHRLPADAVTCLGAACPKPATAAETAALAAPDEEPQAD